MYGKINLNICVLYNNKQENLLQSYSTWSIITYGFNLDFIVKSSYESFSYFEGKGVLSNKWFTF